MIKQNMKHLNRIFIVLDGILVAVSLFFAWYIRIESGLIYVAPYHLTFNEYMKPLLLLIPIYLIAYSLFDLYSPHRTKSLIDEFMNLIKANTAGILAFLSYLYVFREVDYSRMVLIIFYGISIALALLERIIIRYVLRKLRKKSRNLKHIIIVGYSDLAIEYSKRLYQNKHWGYNVVGIFDDDIKREYISLFKETVKVIGRIKDLETYVINNSVDEVIIALSLHKYAKLEAIVNICEKQGVYTRIIPDYYKVMTANPYIEDLDGLPVISLRKIPLNDMFKKNMKRASDLLYSSVGLVLLVPLFAVIAILIKIESKGPIIYKQIRVGLNRKEFLMFKFRTMEVQKESQEKMSWTVANDPRVTKIGAFLRKTSLDEFPQLMNVLKGDMSLIGPRPERPQFVEKYKESVPKYMVKHQVRPGMTGWAQIHGYRGDTSIEKRIEYDLYYIENWSFKIEVKIFILTFFKGFINGNAY